MGLRIPINEDTTHFLFQNEQIYVRLTYVQDGETIQIYRTAEGATIQERLDSAKQLREQIYQDCFGTSYSIEKSRRTKFVPANNKSGKKYVTPYVSKYKTRFNYGYTASVVTPDGKRKRKVVLFDLNKDDPFIAFVQAATLVDQPEGQVQSESEYRKIYQPIDWDAITDKVIQRENERKKST